MADDQSFLDGLMYAARITECPGCKAKLEQEALEFMRKRASRVSQA